jgi:hypothetical protein
MKNQFQRLVISILAQRKKLIEMKCSGKDTALCLAYIKELSIQVEAYKSKWNEEGWKKFIIRNFNKLEYLVPNNKSGQTIKTKLYGIQ